METSASPPPPDARAAASVALTRATVLFALGLALIVGLGLGAVLGLRGAERAAARRVHTYQVADAIDEARAALLDVETSTRGFALAGTPEFLEPYEAGRTNLGPALAAVRALTVDNPVQQTNVAELETLARERLALAEQLVRTRRVEGEAAALQLVKAGAGKNVMDAARRVLARMDAEERRLLVLRDAAVARAGQRVLWLGSLARVGAVALIVAAFLSYRREHRRRAAAEAVLQQANAELERRVAGRTVELTRTNEALTAAQARLRLIIETEPECVKVVSPRGELLEMNAAGLAMLDAASLAEVNAEPLLHFIAPEHQKAFVTLHGEVMAGQAGTLEFETVGRRGTRRWLETHAVPLRENGAVTALLGVTRDITERKQAEAIVACQTKVLGLIASGTPLPETLTVMLHSMEAFAPGMLCSVLLLDADGQRVRHGAAPSLPDAFNRAVDGQFIGASAGSCGTAAFRREAVIVEDILTDPLWADYRELALAHGLRACWSTPIFDAQQRVLGTFAIYYREPGRPTEQHQRCIGVATHLAAVAIAKQRADAVLLKMSFAVEHAGEAVVWVSPAGRILHVNEAACAERGYTRAELLGMTVFDLDPDYQPGVWEPHWAELKRCGSLTFETRHRAKDGRVFPVEVNANFACLDGEEFNFAFVRDISERKRAEAALRESEERFRKVFEEGPVGIATAQLSDRKFSHANPALCELLGYSLAELQARTFAEVTHPEHRAEDAEVIRQLVAGQIHAHTTEKRYLRKDGAVIWATRALTTIRSADGKSDYALAMIQDITERKHAEQERQKFVLLAESSSEFIGMCDLDLQPLYVNPAGMRMVGLPDMDAACRVKVQDYFFPEDQAFIAEEFFPRVLREGHGEVEIRLRHFQTGEAIWMSYYLFHIRDASGRAIGWATVSRDITERKRTDAALREAEARLRLSVAASNIGLWDWNMAVNEVFFSPEWKSQLGYADDEIASRFGEWESRVHPDDLAPTLAKLRHFTEEPAAEYATEFRLRHKDGSWRWIFTQAQLFRDAAGKPLRMMGCHIDITARKRAEEALQALAARLQTIREEERAGIARELHDELGQALTGFKLDLAWLGRRLPADAPESAACREKIAAMLPHADELIHTVQRLSSELRPGVLDDIGLVAAIEWQTGEFARRSSVACDLALPADEPALSPAAGTALYRILQEALTNVARHAQATRVRVTLTVTAGRVRLEVRDDGRGLPAGARTEMKSLGLLGMSERARALGGTVAVAPAPGGGTQVTADLPAV